MADLLTIFGWLFIGAGMGFFVTGALGVLRFPDVFTRLHAVTKTDTVGLGLLSAGLALLAADVLVALLLLVIWLLVMGSSAISCQLLARYSIEFNPLNKPDILDGNQAEDEENG